MKPVEIFFPLSTLNFDTVPLILKLKYSKAFYHLSYKYKIYRKMHYKWNLSWLQWLQRCILANRWHKIWTLLKHKKRQIMTYLETQMTQNDNKWFSLNDALWWFDAMLPIGLEPVNCTQIWISFPVCVLIKRKIQINYISISLLYMHYAYINIFRSGIISKLLIKTLLIFQPKLL